MHCFIEHITPALSGPVHTVNSVVGQLLMEISNSPSIQDDDEEVVKNVGAIAFEGEFSDVPMSTYSYTDAKILCQSHSWRGYCSYLLVLLLSLSR